jgi:hypothetical protein
MQRLIHLVFLLVAPIAWLSPAHAEGGCPPGQVPQQGNGWRSCVPMGGSSSGNGASEFRAPISEPRYIAIAIDSEKQASGASPPSLSFDEADANAVQACMSAGGSRCIVYVSARNGCVTVVSGNGHTYFDSASSQDYAEYKAMDRCKKDGPAECFVYRSACAFAVWR